MLDGRPRIAKLMLKQSLVWYHDSQLMDRLTCGGGFQRSEN